MTPEGILELIKQSMKERGYPPTVRELCQMSGLSAPATVHKHLESLVKSGRIVKQPGSPRAIRIVDDD